MSMCARLSWLSSEGGVGAEAAWRGRRLDTAYTHLASTEAGLADRGHPHSTLIGNAFAPAASPSAHGDG
eukprot:12565092-Alexandrium_andersonii.AAC.1